MLQIFMEIYYHLDIMSNDHYRLQVTVQVLVVTVSKRRLKFKDACDIL